MRLISDDALGVVCVFQEAEGEPHIGKVAVAEVIRRRTKHGTIAGTVLKKYQFSGMNSDSANRIRSFEIDDDNPLVKDCIKAWEESKTSNIVPDCTHYYNPSLCDPYWSHGATIVAEIGRHRFVKLKE